MRMKKDSRLILLCYGFFLVSVARENVFLSKKHTVLPVQNVANIRAQFP